MICRCIDIMEINSASRMSKIDLRSMKVWYRVVGRDSIGDKYRATVSRQLV